jgi:hypothetical protein
MPRRLTNQRRAGSALVELLVAVTLASIVIGAVASLLVRHHRILGALAGVLGARAQLREGTIILPAQLRSAAPAAGDLVTLADTAVALRATVGAGVVCAIDSARHALELPPERLASGQTLSAVVAWPARGDLAFVYDDGTLPGAEDDAWRALPVDTLVVAATGCLGSPLVDPTRDRGALRLAIDPLTPLPPTVALGAPVRITHGVRYRIYNSSAGWSLGLSEWDGSAYTGIQPVSGPYAPPAAPGGVKGLTLRYADSALAATGSARAADVARIDIVLRARTPRLDPNRHLITTDSARTLVAPRGP